MRRLHRLACLAGLFLLVGSAELECPNCHEMIQKNGGCDHMTCQPPGGCGHEFWFTCGCDYKKPHTCQAKTGQRY